MAVHVYPNLYAYRDISFTQLKCDLFRLSPRATSDMSGTLIRVRHTSPIRESEPKQRLSSPDVGPQFEWSHLVDAASAYESEYLMMAELGCQFKDVHFNAILRIYGRWGTTWQCRSTAPGSYYPI